MTAIEFENISKQYRLGLVSTGTLSHDLNRFWQTKILRKEDPYLKVGELNDRTSKGKSDYVWALKDICKLPNNYVICGGPDIKHLAKELIAPIRNAGPWQRMPETTVEYLEFAPHKYAIAFWHPPQHRYTRKQVYNWIVDTIAILEARKKFSVKLDNQNHRLLFSLTCSSMKETISLTFLIYFFTSASSIAHFSAVPGIRSD